MPTIKHCHIGMLCDKSPTVAWANRLTLKRYIRAGRILRALSLQQRRAQVSPLLTMSISGEKNEMTDVTSQSLRYNDYKNLTSTHPSFAHHFNLHLPLSQKQHWQECHLNNVTTAASISELLGMQSQMVMWTLITPQDKNTGATSVHIVGIYCQLITD